MLSEVPEGWQISTLGEVCSPKQHPTIQKTKFTSEGYPVYGANGQIGFFSDYTHGERTLAITCRGATCGTINVVPPKSYITGNAMALDSLDESAVAFDFLNHYLRHFGVDACITGSAQPQITRSSLLPVELLVPPLNEQHRIAEILASVDASIQATQAVIEQAERVKRGLMEELLTGGLGGEAIERGEVPEGWRAISFAEFCEIKAGFGFPVKLQGRTEGDFPFYKVGDMNSLGNEQFMSTANHYVTEVDLPVLKAKPYPAGAVIFPKIGAAIKTNKKRRLTRDSLIDNNVMALIAKDDVVTPDFLFRIMENTDIYQFSSQNGLPSINKSTIAKAEVLIPPLNEQHRISDILSTADEFIAKQKANVEQQVRTKRGLMSDLLTGKVRTV